MRDCVSFIPERERRRKKKRRKGRERRRERERKGYTRTRPFSFEKLLKSTLEGADKRQFFTEIRAGSEYGKDERKKRPTQIYEQSYKSALETTEPRTKVRIIRRITANTIIYMVGNKTIQRKSNDQNDKLLCYNTF